MKKITKSGIVPESYYNSLFSAFCENFRKIWICILLFTFLFVTIPCVMSADFADGLILYHTYDEGDGDVAKDISGSGHDGKIDNPNWVDGKFKKTLKFAGAGSGTFVTVQSTEALNVNECTFMAWVFAEHWNATRQIVGKSVHGGCSGRGQYGLFSEKVFSNSVLKLKEAVLISMPIYLKQRNGYMLLLPTMALPARSTSMEKK